MKLQRTNRRSFPPGLPGAERAQFRIILALAIALVVGGAVAVLYYRHARGGAAGRPAAEPELSEATRSALSRLKAPIGIHFFALLGSTNTPGLAGFAGRVDQLLAAYERAAGGKIQVTRYRGESPGDQEAARAAGLQPFNAEETQASYLGVAMVCGAQKESLPRLAPEWEPALESDLTRALLRLGDRVPTAAPAVEAGPSAAAAAAEVKRLIPDPRAVSLEEATRIIHNANLNEFKEAAQKMESQIKQARERLSQAQASGSESGQQTAMKELQQLQTEQIEKLRQIAARSQAQLEALRAMQATNR